jgi:hypothetical protein
MAEEKILGKVDPDRRSFLKRVLGASFALPVIATFSVESLSIDSAQAYAVNATSTAPNCLSVIGQNGCWPDA